MQKLYYNYEKFQKDTNKLIIKIDTSFEAILAISRGGLILGQVLGESFNIRNVLSVNIIGYDDTKQNSSIKIFNLPDLSKYKSILIVDEIIDSGNSMKELVNKINKLYPNLNIKIATLFYKKTASIQPDFTINEANMWIEFFWTKDYQKKKIYK